jgi:arylsulfatase A-like enzyme
VLVFVTDDQRADTLSVMPKTRALLSRRGVRFSNAVVTTPLCCPARATIYSGKYSHNHGVWDNDNDSGLLDTDQTVQKVLRDAGYFTAHVDRYLNNWEEWTSHPPDFDQYAVQLEGHKAWEGRREALVNGERVQVTEYTTRWIARLAGEFLARFEVEQDERPWLMFVATRAPHLPAVPENRYERAAIPSYSPPPSIEEDLSDKPWLEEFQEYDPERAAGRRARQLRSLRSVDDLVEGLLAQLEAAGELRNTLIMFTSDNGELWGEHGLTRKRWPYDESLRVPMLLRWDAGGVPSGVVRDDVVANVDVAPTIYDATGIDPPYPVDGRSMLSDTGRESILIEYRHDSDNPTIPAYSGVWSPGEVFIRFPQVGRTEYYEADDPYQLTNLSVAGSSPDLGRFLSLLRAWETCSGSSCP